MIKSSKILAARILAFSVACSLTMMPFTAYAAGGKIRFGRVTEFGLGGEPVTATQGDCTGTSLPACTVGHTCECIKVTPMLQVAGEGKAVLVKAEKARPLAETMLVDLTESSSNGAGGLCYPWNGLGLLAISSSTSITLHEHGSMCEDDDSTELVVAGDFDLEEGKGLFSGAQGRGDISFNLESAAAPSSGAGRAPGFILPIVIASALVSLAWAAAEGQFGCLIDANLPKCKK